MATDLEHKYSSAQDTSVTATHHLVSQVPAVTISQTHTCTTPLPQSTVPLTQPPVSASPYHSPPQPRPSRFPLWSVPYYYPPPTSYPVSTHFLPPPLSEVDSTTTTHPAYSQLSHVTCGPTPSRAIPPTLVPVQQATLPSDAMQSMTTPHTSLQCAVKPGVAAGMYVLQCFS